jgi:hypothetical protein
MKMLGDYSLDQAQELRVESELQDRAASRFFCELCVNHLVRPLAKCAGHPITAEHVWPAEPATIAKRRLKDHLNTYSNRLNRTGNRLSTHSLG